MAKEGSESIGTCNIKLKRHKNRSFHHFEDNSCWKFIKRILAFGGKLLEVDKVGFLLVTITPRDETSKAF